MFNDDPPAADPVSAHDILLTAVETARLLGLSPRTMDKMRNQGRGPKYIVVSCRCIRYRRADIDAWIDARVRHKTTPPCHPARAAARRADTFSIASR